MIPIFQRHLQISETFFFSLPSSIMKVLLSCNLCLIKSSTVRLVLISSIISSCNELVVLIVIKVLFEAQMFDFVMRQA